MPVLTRTAAVLVATVALAAAGAVIAPTAMAAPPVGPGEEGAAPGCVLQCITLALVTPTAADASVDVRTSVPASVVVTVTPAGAPLDLAAAPGAAAADDGQHVSVPVPALQRTVHVPGLQPDTEYRIIVAARDVAGHTSVRVGTFRTRAVEVAVDTPPAPAFDSGAGCHAACILSASATNSATVVGRSRLDVRTAVPAEVTLRVSLARRPGRVLRTVRSSGPVTRFRPLLEGLQAGRRYRVVAEARDARGGLHRRVGTFHTARARAVVTVARVKIVDDGDRGRNRGELAFTYRINGEVFGGPYARRSSGDVFTPSAASLVVPADGNPAITVSVRGDECDAALYKNCTSEVQADSPPVHSWARGGGSDDGDEYAWVRGTWRLDDLREPSSLPAWFGSGLTPPPGFDAYTLIQNTDHHLKFRAGITVDLQVVS